MSSVASKHALLIALGGFSIAALFVWYVKTGKIPDDVNVVIVFLSAGTSTKRTKANAKRRK